MTELNRFKNGKIYTIRCRKDDTLIYVGSTIQLLSKRWYEHKSRCYKGKETNQLIYKKIRENDGVENFYIELYENYNCTSKEALNQREGEVIRMIGTLNKNVAGRTKTIYTRERKEEKMVYDKSYRIEHTEKC